MGYARSLFQVDFNIATAHDYTLSGQLVEVGSANTRYRITLSELNGPAIHELETEDPISELGTLPSGDYRLKIEARVSWFANGSGFTNSRTEYQNVQLVLAAVPEPCSLALLGLGAAAILRRRR